MLGKVSGQYDTAYARINQTIKRTGTVISAMADQALEKNGEVSDFIDRMSVQAENTSKLWQSFYDLVRRNAEDTIDPSSAVSVFLKMMDTGTLKPIENWVEFARCVGSSQINSESLNLFLDIANQGTTVPTENWVAFENTIRESDLQTADIVAKLEEIDRDTAQPGDTWLNTKATIETTPMDTSAILQKLKEIDQQAA